MKALALLGFLAMLAPLARAADVDPVAAARLYDYAFTRTGADAEKKGVRTDGLVVVKGGEVVLERYHEAGGFTATTPHISWSVAKSFAQALVGVAAQQGRLSLDDAVAKYIPGRPAALKIRDVLEMSSCLEWAETYEGSDFTQSSVLAMLYGKGRRDMAAYVAAKPLTCTPGSKWEYASGSTIEIMQILKAVYGDQYALLPWTELFQPLGIASATWETDTAGTFVGSSYLYATPRDLARFGELYLHDGVWQGKRLLPEGWAAYSAAPSPALLRPDAAFDPREGLGGPHWWSNAAVPAKNLRSMWPAAPADMFAALGHWGQVIFVIPSLDMVIVRVGDDRDVSVDGNELLKLVFAAVKVPLPAQPDRDPATNAATIGTMEKENLHETPFWGIPGLSSAFVSKELCSCLFVSKRSEEQCAVYASQDPMFAAYTIDWSHKVVRAALRFASVGGHGLFPSVAKYRSQEHGCGFE